MATPEGYTARRHQVTLSSIQVGMILMSLDEILPIDHRGDWDDMIKMMQGILKKNDPSYFDHLVKRRIITDHTGG